MKNLPIKSFDLQRNVKMPKKFPPRLQTTQTRRRRLNSQGSELMAINRVFSFCALNPKLHGQVIEVDSDSLIAVTWINQDSYGSFTHIKLVYDIRDLMRAHGFMMVRFCSRTSNFYVDSLAKKGSNRDGDVIRWGYL